MTMERHSLALSLDIAPVRIRDPPNTYRPRVCECPKDQNTRACCGQLDSASSGGSGLCNLASRAPRSSPKPSVDEKDVGALAIVDVQQVIDKGEERREVDPCLPIRNICVIGLLLAIVSAVTAIALGFYLVRAGQMPVPAFLQGTSSWVGLTNTLFYGPGASWYYTGHWAVGASQSAGVLLPFISSYIVTALLDCAGNIRSTSLRWALYEEGRLEFHSNPRLFSASRCHCPNKWYANALAALTSIVAYGAQSLLFTQIQVIEYLDEEGNPLPDARRTSAHYGIDVNGWALAIFGLVLLLHCSLAAWSLLSGHSLVRTWSAHVLATVQVSARDQPFTRGCIDEVGASTRSGSPTPPKNTTRRQESGHVSPNPANTRSKSARDVVPSVRHLNLCLWLLLGLSTICVIIVALLARYLPIMYDSVSKSYVETYGVDGPTGPATVQGYWTTWGQVFFMVAPGWDLSKGRDWLSVIIASGFQTPLALGLHYAEILAEVLGDEHEWRAFVAPNHHTKYAYARRIISRGGNLFPAWVVANLPHWPTLLLFLFKGFAQWIFSCTTYVQYIVIISLLPLIILTVLLLVLAIVAELLGRHRPRSEKPPTYGNLALCRQALEWR